jgi:hypothetical protein
LLIDFIDGYLEINKYKLLPPHNMMIVLRARSKDML